MGNYFRGTKVVKWVFIRGKDKTGVLWVIDSKRLRTAVVNKYLFLCHQLTLNMCSQYKNNFNN